MSFFWGTSEPAEPVAVEPFDPRSEMPTNGRLGHLTPEQTAALAQFKQELAAEGYYDPEKHDDYILLRFLRARKFDLPASKKMWIDFQEWRKKWNVDNTVTDFDFPEWAIVQQYYPRFYHGVDKCGRPIYVEQIGLLDIQKLFTITTQERMMLNHVHEYERLILYRLPASSIKTGVHLEQSFTIMDLKNISLSQFYNAFHLVREASTIAQNYYPEMLGKMVVINAPMLFTSLWLMVKPLLDEVTVKKISIFGGPSSYLPELLKYIDEDQLPAFMGGKCNCPEGCEHSDKGPWSDGSVPGYPDPKFERLRDTYGIIPKKAPATN
ncbi:CRAL-TRIO domain-containing protein [Polychytrium aggregatum]|uniref:CRAL-TRIO domain-containing protein n=1 Tax=Polychytrium aggregatum TaxID=110093 RepID=UPI0022FE9270|nr:CRAL-TRIO domain-containing protein [Polychytrium aggregatum]KAI9202559.1 CRAL-TRIO domain-containing protein [Polychytrium aggregatum]